MVKKEEKSEEVIVTDDFYIFPDKIQVKVSEVNIAMSSSKLTEIEIEQWELEHGKPYAMLFAEGIHRRIMAAREKNKQRDEEFKARVEADRQRAVSRGKALYDDGCLIVIHDGKILTPLEPMPELSDDDWLCVFNFYTAIHPILGKVDIVKNVLELVIFERKHPGYRFFLTRKNFQ